jgi:hypothetical protein
VNTSKPAAPKCLIHIRLLDAGKAFSVFSFDSANSGWLRRVVERQIPDHSGELKRERAEAKAEGIIREELKERRWTERDLEERAKSDAEKLAMAARLRRETTLTIPAIAARLHMGGWKSFAAKQHRWKRTHQNMERR